MKKAGKSLVFILMAALVVTVSGNVYGQRSKIDYGDKNSKNIEASVQIFHQQIAGYQLKIDELRSTNKNLWQLFQRSEDNDYVKRYAQQIRYNDSLIAEYDQKINYLEQQTDEFISVAAGKDNQKICKLRGKAEDVATAYVIIAYAEQADRRDSVAQLTGLLVNKWHYPVTAIVTGPGNFYREFSLRAKDGQAVFSLPSPGRYTTTFVFDTQRRSIVKTAGISHVYYDDDGQAYDYKATLLKN
ncbi:TPA: hypothetical protein DCZ15_04295 [Candidatus Falkowbacteria bacterium]|nr:MAG: hypothetical protein UV95_C0001G0315 [Candidatus Falkowbacteria bacterium GW2011_GWF2_43_32]HBA37056.1 hypothetical protein [Candidatus Falkowbacteria bacterium]